MSKAKPIPLTHEQKIAKGYESVGQVGTLHVYLTPGDLTRIKRGVSDRAKLIEYKMAQETAKQEGSAESNAPMVFEISQNGRNLLCKQTGTRQWLVLSPAKVAELFARQAEVNALVAKIAPESK